MIISTNLPLKVNHYYSHKSTVRLTPPTQVAEDKSRESAISICHFRSASKLLLPEGDTNHQNHLSKRCGVDEIPHHMAIKIVSSISFSPISFTRSISQENPQPVALRQILETLKIIRILSRLLYFCSMRYVRRVTSRYGFHFYSFRLLLNQLAKIDYWQIGNSIKSIRDAVKCGSISLFKTMLFELKRFEFLSQRESWGKTRSQWFIKRVHKTYYVRRCQ